MARFPIIERLQVRGYRLYPGADGAGLDATLGLGPWIVLGVNGLGKSTLLLLLRYLLVGNVRVRSPGFSGETRSDLFNADQRIFATRVADGAREAIAELEVSFGAKTFVIERRIGDLSLVGFAEKGSQVPPSQPDESSFREAIAEAFGISDFANVVRLVDRVVFAFMETESFVLWDTASQYEIFRALLLSPDDSRELRSLEGAIVSADSAARNLNAVLYGISKRQDKDAKKIGSAAATRAKLAQTNADLASSQEREQKYQRQLEKSDLRRSDARTRLYRGERERDDAEHAYEQAKFAVLQHHLAKATPTQQYVLLKFLSANECIACGSKVPKMASEVEARRARGECLVCGTPLSADHSKASQKSLDKRAQDTYERLDQCRKDLLQSEKEFLEAEAECTKLSDAVRQERERLDHLQVQVSRLIRQLPQKDQAGLTRDNDRIKTLRSEVIKFRQDREKAEQEIDVLIARMREGVEGVRSKVEARFLHRAKQFFTERVRLVYAPRQERIGQQGRAFEFPAFDVEMTSGATDGRYTRRTADSVSLSQRQYLDLLYRIAIMEVIGSGSHMLVVDGPEGSLDAVFAERAGNMFATFAATSNKNSVIAACNVVEGAFIPSLLQAYRTPTQRKARLINLLDIGVPTAALRDLEREYRAAVQKILVAG